MLTIQSTVVVDRITARQISDFLLDCTDEDYRRWWPGTHLRFHIRARGTDHIGTSSTWMSTSAYGECE